MSRFVGFAEPVDRSDASSVAILLINLGTPAAPTPAAVRRYLAEFLADPRVVELPRWLWWPLLHGVVLRTRPRRSAEAYAKIWRDDGSPLLANSQRLTTALRAEIARRGFSNVRVELAMTYGSPVLPTVMQRLLEQGVRKLVALPLFPQYSATSTGAAMDALLRGMQQMRRLPALRTVTDYHLDAGYIAALADSIRTHWNEHGRGDQLLLSFHGIPERYAQAGDPYPAQCHATANKLAQLLGISDAEILTTFQSRLGRLPWLQPYTDTAIERLARAGVKSLDVACPGFAVDCLETLEEVALRYRARFLNLGGRRFRYILALNDGAAHVSALADIAIAQLAGWMPEASV